MSEAKPPRKRKASKPPVTYPAAEQSSRRATYPAAEQSSRRATYPAAEQSSRPDIAILGGPTEDGQGAHLLRFREGSISAGEIRPVREGEPITHKELVRLHPVDEERRICRVETLHEPPALPTTTASPGPARVSNERYRKNWDQIFDAKGERPKPDWDVN